MIVVVNETDVVIDYKKIFKEIVHENPTSRDTNSYMKDDNFLAYNLYELSDKKIILVKCFRSKREEAKNKYLIKIKSK